MLDAQFLGSKYTSPVAWNRYSGFARYSLSVSSSGNPGYNGAGTRFFSTAAHCFRGATSQIYGGAYTVAANGLTLCSQPDVSNCDDANLWYVVRFPATGNAAVYINDAAKAKLLQGKDNEVSDDWAVLAAYPAKALTPPPSQTVQTWSQALLCQQGRNYR